MNKLSKMFLTVLFTGMTCNPTFAEIRLINAGSGKPIATIQHGSAILKTAIGTNATFQYVPESAIRSNISSTVFKLSGPYSKSYTEKLAPFCFLGNTGSYCNRGKNFSLGDYKLQVTAVLKDGTKKSETVTFKVANSTVPPTVVPTINPTVVPTVPTIVPTIKPTIQPTVNPTVIPTIAPTKPPLGTVDFPIDACGKAPCEFPTADNTGLTVSKSSLRSVSGRQSSKYDGEVIENLRLNDSLDIFHDNVTVRNVLIEDGTIKVENGAKNWLIEHVEITAPNQGNHIVTSRGGSGTARFVYAHHGESDFLRAGSNQVFECNYVTKLGLGATSHADVVQFFTNSDTTYENTTFRYNNFEIKPQDCDKDTINPRCEANPDGYRSNTLLITSGNASTKNITWECNWNLNGGGYTMYANGGKSISSPNKAFIIRNNLFGCNAKFGLTTGYDRNNNIWEGNIDVCSGEEIKK